MAEDKKQTKKKEKKEKIGTMKRMKADEKKDYKPLPRDEKFVEEEAKKLEETERAKAEEKKEEAKKEEKKPEKKDKDKKKDKKEEKVVLEREYVIPLRRGVQKVPRYKRAKKAIRVIREFLVRHMKVYDRDLRVIKIDQWLNEELWFRGIKKPPAKIKVIAKKFADGIVRVELAEIPDAIKWKIQKEKKRQDRVKEVKKIEKPKEEKETEEEKKEEEEKEKSVVAAGLKSQEKAAKQMKHTTSGAHAKTTSPVRKSLKK